MSHTLSNSKGASLGDLLVAVGIASVLAATAGPWIVGATEAAEVRSATFRVYAELQAARSGAVMEGKRYAFRVGNDQRSFGLYADRDRSGTFTSDELVRSGSVQDGKDDFRLVTPGDVVFAPNGRALSSGSLTVYGTAGTRLLDVTSSGQIRVVR